MNVLHVIKWEHLTGLHAIFLTVIILDDDISEPEISKSKVLFIIVSFLLKVASLMGLSNFFPEHYYFPNLVWKEAIGTFL
jgi:hypothetical protein